MAHYTTSAPTAWDAADAFSYMADLRNFPEWDPGTVRATQLTGDGPGPDATYDLEVRAAGGRTTVMRYEVTEWDPPHRIVLTASTRVLRSVDEIRVGASPSGAVVTYDAQLDLSGALRLADPLLGLAFRRIGDRAAAGLRRTLAGDATVGRP